MYSDLLSELAQLKQDMSNLFPEPSQASIGFPAPLTEKHRPHRISEFVGIEQAKRALSALLQNPHPCALLFTGGPGVGKTTIAMAFAEQLHAGLIHHASARLTVDAVLATQDKIQYYPESGGFWVVLCDEADRMSSQAQIALLSTLDSCNTLRPTFGGGWEEGVPLPVMWIFTCNGTGDDQTEPPRGLEPRFLSRCLRIPFPPINGEMPTYLQSIWRRETQGKDLDFTQLAEDAGGSVRDALQAMELRILTA